jgi:hypothetical protein
MFDEMPIFVARPNGIAEALAEVAMMPITASPNEILISCSTEGLDAKHPSRPI